MWKIQNIFIAIKKYCDLINHQRFLNHHLIKFANLINQKIGFNFFQENLLRDTFWQLSNKDTIYIDRSNLYELLSVLFMRLFTGEILYREKIISQNIILLIEKWQNYCTNRFVPFIFDISNELVWMISSDFPVPEPDNQTSLTLYEETLLDRDSKLKDMLGDSSLATIRQIDQFKKEFKNFYGIFENKCKYVEKDLARLEGRNIQNTMHNIFQLNNANERTPPDLVRDTLKELIHIRNAIAHNFFTDLHNGQVRIRDKNPRDEWTYDKTFTITNLWNLYYFLIIFDRVLVSMALFLFFIRRVKEKMNSMVTLLCGQCGYVKKIYLSPQTKPSDIIICEKCGSISFVKNLMKIDTRFPSN